MIKQKAQVTVRLGLILALYSLSTPYKTHLPVGSRAYQSLSCQSEVWHLESLRTQAWHRHTQRSRSVHNWQGRGIGEQRQQTAGFPRAQGTCPGQEQLSTSTDVSQSGLLSG